MIEIDKDTIIEIKLPNQVATIYSNNIKPIDIELNHSLMPMAYNAPILHYKELPVNID